MKWTGRLAMLPPGRSKVSLTLVLSPEVGHVRPGFPSVSA
jgi:hypothetical protein